VEDKRLYKKEYNIMLNGKNNEDTEVRYKGYNYGFNSEISKRNITIITGKVK